MPKVKKGNRILNVDKDRVESYLKQGYDEIDESGKVVKHATGGKSVPVGEYNKLLEKLAEFESANTEELKNEIADLKAEVKKLKAENTKLLNENKAQQEAKK
ncbi:hypothetical protein [Halalkalibacterium ligniniphilum]|uniref:hypothetical protein n=1 Tax=Halalkalibacterium ligniniphilum TaxID=1134413 RepID=UPI00034C557A|nr:hypothetical protein [Halalkalibacterium ligniniphilum]